MSVTLKFPLISKLKKEKINDKKQNFYSCCR